MKKMIFTLAIVITTLSAFANREKVSSETLTAFKKDFNTAQEVQWTIGTSYYIASFTYNDKHIVAYYTTDGELLGLSRNISSDTLPIGLQYSLKNNYSEYWITELFEVTKDGRVDYYVTLENAQKKIVLQSSENNDWYTMRKIRKD